MNKITIDTSVQPKSYSVYIGYDIMEDIALEIVKSQSIDKYAIITDNNVKKLYGNRFLRILSEHNLNSLLFDFPAGEIHKTRETKRQLEDQLLNNHFGRDCAIIALGGGVVGDMAGFVAATYMRGVPHIQVPTTTISQGDSSIGGKTAIDVPQGKNLIGAFHHPKSVFIDLKTLESLDERSYRGGLIEIVKHGLIKSNPFLEFIESNIDTILSRQSEDYSSVMVELMKKNCKIKNDVVLLDDRENNLRKVLNYGHTVAHAIEFLSDYTLLHGEAVAIGIACEAFFSYKLGYCSKEHMDRQINMIKRLGLFHAIPGHISADQMIAKMRLDKKARSMEPEFVLLEEIGQAKVFANGLYTTKIPSEKLCSMLIELKQGVLN